MLIALMLAMISVAATQGPKDPIVTDLTQVHGAAEHAAELLTGRTPEKTAEAVELLEQVIATQETRPAAAYRGNFPWRFDRPVVEDLNSVEFTLRAIIPMMIRDGSRLPEDLQARLRETIRLGLEEIARLDVDVMYTNIAASDCVNTVLGGELLGDAAIAERGYARLREFTDVAAENGTVFEFNSPTYTRHVTLDAMQVLAKYTKNRDAKCIAWEFLARQALSVALHMHLGTGYWAGPHSRAYYPTVSGMDGPELADIEARVADGRLPGWLRHVLKDTRLPRQIDETAVAKWKVTTTAYHTADYAMSLATRDISRQTKPFYVHYKIPGETRAGIVYARYLVNDTWYGDPEQAPTATERKTFFDEGTFAGVQSGPRAICVYSPRSEAYTSSLAPSHTDKVRSLKAVLVWTRRPQVDGIWIGSDRVEQVPVEVPRGKTVVVSSGSILLAVRPLSIDDLGNGAPIRLAERDDELVLELYNYLGPEKEFWDRDPTSRFYQGEPRCAFYAEVAERAAYADGAAFAAAVDAGAIRDESAAPFTVYREEEAPQRPWTLEYAREGRTLGIELNLMDLGIQRRWNEAGNLGFPMLESPVARQNDTGRIEVGDAVLTFGAGAPAWLYANPEAGLYVAGYHGPVTLLELKTPDGWTYRQSMGTGVMVVGKDYSETQAIGATERPTGQYVIE